MVRQHKNLLEARLDGFYEIDVNNEIAKYIAFRKEVADFFKSYLEHICSEKCYGSRLSACCSKDGIIVFWADMVINAYRSNQGELDRLEMAIKNPVDKYKCIYLTQNGCAWRVKPIICEMFLCPDAEAVFDSFPEAKNNWNELKECKKAFTWPDRPVLFEMLERPFIEAGHESPLMYMHKSPGLLKMIQRRNVSI